MQLFHEVMLADSGAFPVLHTRDIYFSEFNEPLKSVEVVWPSSLTSLVFTSIDNARPDLLISSLPKHFTHLDGGYNSFLDPSVAFPDSLVSLHLYLDTFVDFLPLLPATLEKLSFSYQYGDSDLEEQSPLFREWVRRALRGLPGALKSLRLP